MDEEDKHVIGADWSGEEWTLVVILMLVTFMFGWLIGHDTLIGIFLFVFITGPMWLWLIYRAIGWVYHELRSR